MRKLLAQLLRDQNGMILSSEVVLVGTILVLGSIVGLAAVSHAVTHELNDVANAYQANNGYGTYAGDGSYGADGGTGYTPAAGYQYTVTDSVGQPEVAGY